MQFANNPRISYKTKDKEENIIPFSSSSSSAPYCEPLVPLLTLPSFLTKEGVWDMGNYGVGQNSGLDEAS
ncbi:hypothetical protein LIER_17279 [Lithospermum erythrorhizon]|uniref:Uncharacterized protein n=1 Tax=Lithospermum erythrorhizon TaxID=34254 RepID=A0AAV3QBX8_LITER